MSYSSPDINNKIMSMKTMWHVACLQEIGREYKVCLENLNRKNHLGGLFNRQCLTEIRWEDWIVFVRLMIRTCGGFIGNLQQITQTALLVC